MDEINKNTNNISSLILYNHIILNNLSISIEYIWSGTDSYAISRNIAWTDSGQALQRHGSWTGRRETQGIVEKETSYLGYDIRCNLSVLNLSVRGMDYIFNIWGTGQVPDPDSICRFGIGRPSIRTSKNYNFRRYLNIFVVSFVSCFKIILI